MRKRRPIIRLSVANAYLSSNGLNDPTAQQWNLCQRRGLSRGARNSCFNRWQWLSSDVPLSIRTPSHYTKDVNPCSMKQLSVSSSCWRIVSTGGSGASTANEGDVPDDSPTDDVRVSLVLLLSDSDQIADGESERYNNDFVLVLTRYWLVFFYALRKSDVNIDFYF